MRAVVELPVNDEADTPPPEYSDESLALRFALTHEETLRYIAVWGRWYEWSGVVWAPDDTLAAFDLIRRECRAAAAELTTRNSDTAKRQAAKVASAPTVAAIQRLARSDRRLAATVSQWDCERDVFTTPGETDDD